MEEELKMDKYTKIKVRKLFDLIVGETTGDCFKSGGQYIDFENGKCISENDIEQWIIEFEDLYDKVQQVLDQFYDEALFTEEEADEKLLKITGSDRFYTYPNKCSSNFNLESYVLYRARKIEKESKEVESFEY